MKSRKRISIIVALAMVLSLFAAMPMTASAAHSPGVIDLGALSDGDNEASVWSYASATNTITVADSVTISGTKSGAINGDTLVINIASGKTVTWTANYSGDNDDSLIELKGSGTFRVTSGSILASGLQGYALDNKGTVVIEVSGTGFIEAYESTCTIFTGSNITVSGGTVGVEGIDTMAAINVVNTGAVTVTGGTVRATGAYNNDAISSDGGGGVTITGGTVSATVGKAIRAGDVTLSGGTVSATSGVAIEASYIDVTGTASVRSNTGSTAIKANWLSADVATGNLTVTGNVEMNNGKIWASYNGEITVTGNVVCVANTGSAGIGTGDSGTNDSAKVTIIGNVSFSGTNGKNIEAYDGGKTYITGTITGNPVIYVDTKTLTLGTPTTPIGLQKDGYYWDIYTDVDTTSPSSYVYIRKGAISTGNTGSSSGGSAPANPTGSFSGGSSYTVGGSTGLVYIVNKDFAHFNNVKVGTTTLVKDKDYKAENGSTKITLLPSYLDTLSAGTYTMTVGFKDNTTATAKFTVAAAAVQPITPTMPVNPFSDVKGTDWFIDDVIYAVSLGLIDGKTPTTFAPSDNLTYAEAVKLAACMHELYTTDKITLANGNPWYQSYVDYAKKNGIIDGDFDWNAPATRAGYMAIFAKALPADGLKAINDIADGSIPDVAITDANVAAIYKLYKAGIVQGVDDDHNCNPASNIKRSEVAAILTRMMDEDARVTFSI